VNCHKKSSNSGGKRSKKRTNRIYHTDDKHGYDLIVLGGGMAGLPVAMKCGYSGWT